MISCIHINAIAVLQAANALVETLKFKAHKLLKLKIILPLFIFVGIIYLGTLVSIGKASALSSDIPKSGDPVITKVISKADVIADAPSVRLAAFIDGDVNDFKVILSKGVAKVTRPFTGLYCITPSIDLNLNRTVPIVSTDVARSSFDSPQGILVGYYSKSENFCGAGIGIYTSQFRGSTFGFTQSNEIAFTIIIP